MCGIDGESLFAEDRLVVGKSEHAILEMVRVRAGDIDKVNIRVFDEVGVGAVGGTIRGFHVLGDEGLSARFGAARGDGRDGVGNVVDAAEGRVDEEVFDEGGSDAAGGCWGLATSLSKKLR